MKDIVVLRANGLSDAPRSRARNWWSCLRCWGWCSP